MKILAIKPYRAKGKLYAHVDFEDEDGKWNTETFMVGEAESPGDFHLRIKRVVGEQSKRLHDFHDYFAGAAAVGQ